MSNKNKLTPVMQQYVDLKAENKDAILMFRLGDFYELFFEDAKIASKVLGLVLTQRGQDENGDNIPMAGIPWHAADNYFARLVRAGHSVALVEQMETPAQAKARGRSYIEREIVRVLTPGTLTDENLLTPNQSNFLVAILEKSHGVFELSGCDISTGEFFMGKSQNIIDDLVRISPAEVIYPETDAEKETIIQIRELFKTTPVYEKLYLRADIDKVVSRVFGQKLDVSTDTVYAASSNAVSLLAGYLFNTQRDTTISFRAPYSFNQGKQILIDSATWKSLEIDSAINEGGICLVDVLDKTRTPQGARKLRSYLRTLSSDITEIRRRQEHVGHLLLNRDLMGQLHSSLGKIPDVGRSLSRLLSGRGTPRDMRACCDFLIMLPDIKNIGTRLDANFSDKFKDIKSHDLIASELKFALVDKLPTFFRDGGIIREGFDKSLDAMKVLSKGAKETIAALQAQYINQTDVSTLKIRFNNILGYFIEVPSARSDVLMNPNNGFIHRQTMVNNMRFTTERLIELDNEVRGAAEKAAAIESEIIEKLILKIRDISDDVLDTADLISKLDVWYSLAVCADEYSWTRPVITLDASFDIKAGRHPVIEYVLNRRADKFVKNDCSLNQFPVALLTGPNMAGKSTYLRQNALIVVLAHLGSFVPCESATLGICDQLFSRVGASDNLAAGQSTFMVEMIETANILNRATSKSFIIFDEVGRGTATYDGMAIAQSILEFLNNLKPRTLFATHYHELTNLVGNKSGGLSDTQCLTIDIREHDNEIIFMHKIIPGVANKSYGIHVAKMAGMPSTVVARAESILNSLEDAKVSLTRGKSSCLDTCAKEAVVKDASLQVIEVENIADEINEPGVRPILKASEDKKVPKAQLSLFG